MHPEFGIEHPTTQIGYHIMLDRNRRDSRTPIWLKGPTAITTLDATFPPVVEALTDSLDTVALGVLFRALLLTNTVVGSRGNQCLRLLDIIPKMDHYHVNIAFPPTT